MRDMPEKIWITFARKDCKRHPKDKGSTSYIGDACDGPTDSDAEYIRAGTVESLRAENERLRDYLERIDLASNHYAMTPTYSEGTLRYAHQSTRNLARAALQEDDQ